MDWGGLVPTLNAFDMGDSRATVIIFEATRVDDVRIYDKYCPTVATYWGTGGARVPYVFELEDEDQVEENNLIAFDTQFGSNANTFENLSPTLKASQQPPSFSAFPIQDGREIEKNQNGLGVGSNTDPSYTLDQTGSQAVAYPIQSTVIGRQDHNGPQGKGYGMETDPMFTLDGAGAHGVATPPAVVRRLTPTECERLQGFPDDWTADQADSNRYKQMGNAVTVNVIQWIGARL